LKLLAINLKIYFFAYCGIIYIYLFNKKKILSEIKNNLEVNFCGLFTMRFLQSRKDPVNPLPFKVYYFVVVCLAICGLIASLYLSISHYRVYTDIGYRSFCAITRAINCDTVSQSPYSIFLNLPVPVWGVLGYTYFLLLMPFAWLQEAKQKRIWTLFFWIGCLFSCISVLLAFISSYFIGSYCIMCIVTYGVNLLLWLFAWIIHRRFSSEGLIKASREDLRFLWQKKTKTMALLLSFVAVLILIKMYFPAYWTFAPPPISLDLPTGITKDGHPWIGAESPKLVITEYSDYLCFQCRKMHFYLRELISRHPGKIRLIHRHFPMDRRINPIVKTPFHKGAGILALLAIYSGQNGKFWQANDYLYNTVGDTKYFDLHKMAQAVGLDFLGLRGANRDQRIRLKLRSDIWQGLKSGITGTPTYVINDKVYQAEIPTEILKSVLE